MAAKSGMARFGACTITNNKKLMNVSISDKELADATSRSTCKIVPNDDGVHYEVEWEGNTSKRTPDQVHTLLYRKLHGELHELLMLSIHIYLDMISCSYFNFIFQKLLQAHYILEKQLFQLSLQFLLTSAQPVGKK